MEILKWCLEALCMVLPTMIAVFTGRLLSASKKQDDANSGKNTITLPKQYFWVCVIACLVFVALNLVLLFLPDNMVEPPEARIPAVIIFFIIALGPFFGVVYCYCWRVEIGIETFTVRTLWRRKREYRYSEVTYKRLQSCTRVYYENVCILTLNYLQCDAEKLINRIAKHTPKIDR